MPKPIKGNQSLDATRDRRSATLDDVYEVVTFIKDNAVTKEEFGNVVTKEEFSDLKGEVSSIKAMMVTKDYLDEKMADLRGDLVVMMRKEDTKLLTLVDVLHGKKVLNTKDVKKILALEPFAH